MKSLSEVLIQADKADSIKELLHIFKNMYENRYHYTLVELEFAKEHFDDLAKQMAKRDALEDATFLKDLLGL